MAINNQKVLGTINRFPRWLATLKWDPFNGEPPSELIIQTERQVVIHMNEDTSYMLEINKSFSEHWKN